MPSVSKSKTRSSNKGTSGTMKEQPKDVVKSTVSTSGVKGALGAVENPIVGTAHQPENAVHGNGVTRSVDECDTHSGSSVTSPEYDSVSNNDSYSGESEDLKEKPVCNIVDAEKREKIRLRNEKKHQRQRERRAHELHERCCSLLISRKLDSLSRQLVAMGFTSERANAALMMNDGKLEESVLWLLEGNTEASKKSTKDANERLLKIDITDELAQVAAIERRYNCSKKDVERAVVSSEGDLQKAEEMVRLQKQELLLSSSKSEETNNNSVPQLEKSLGSDSIQQLKSERDPNYYNAVHARAASLDRLESVSKLSRDGHLSGVSDGSWQPLVSNLQHNTFAPSVSGLPRPSTIANVMDARRINAGHVVMNFQQTGVREPLSVMQRPQYNSSKQVQQAASMSSPGNVAGPFPLNAAGYESLIPNRNVQLNQSLVSAGSRNVHQQQTNYQADYRHHDTAASLSEMSRRQLGNSGSRTPMTPTSPPLNTPSSLGLFSTRTNGHSDSSSPHVDWNHIDWYTAGQMPLCDYNSIDWTMDSTTLSKSKSQWDDGFGLSSIWTNTSTNSDTMSGFSKGLMTGRNMPVGGSHEWTSPFGGNDVFSAPRQFVNSTSHW